MSDLRKQVSDSQDIPEELVDLPAEWGGGRVLVRGLSAGELSDWASATGKQPAKVQSAELLITCVRDPETGKPLFERADRDMLIGKAARPFAELLAHCHRLSGLVQDEAVTADLKADG